MFEHAAHPEWPPPSTDDRSFSRRLFSRKRQLLYAAHCSRKKSFREGHGFSPYSISSSPIGLPGGAVDNWLWLELLWITLESGDATLDFHAALLSRDGNCPIACSFPTTTERAANEVFGSAASRNSASTTRAFTASLTRTERPAFGVAALADRSAASITSSRVGSDTTRAWYSTSRFARSGWSRRASVKSAALSAVAMGSKVRLV